MRLFQSCIGVVILEFYPPERVLCIPVIPLAHNRPPRTRHAVRYSLVTEAMLCSCHLHDIHSYSEVIADRVLHPEDRCITVLRNVGIVTRRHNLEDCYMAIPRLENGGRRDGRTGL